MDNDTKLQLLAEMHLANIVRIRPVLDKIADKCTIMILTAIYPRPTRFSQI
jgi:DNA-binding HxlR family transcriptional regulator